MRLNDVVAHMESQSHVARPYPPEDIKYLMCLVHLAWRERRQDFDDVPSYVASIVNSIQARLARIMRTHQPDTIIQGR